MVGRELAGRLAGGDTDAVRDLYREYGRLVFTVANRVLGDRGLAEEATQQAFV
ncbi:MAG: RNA polymerase sigma factor, partial [Actinobacteria bacterium]|nr:RNA polymerase sigma factor [Actinomycetota bacterium]